MTLRFAPRKAWHYKVENDGISGKYLTFPNELIIVVCRNVYRGCIKFIRLYTNVTRKLSYFKITLICQKLAARDFASNKARFKKGRRKIEHRKYWMVILDWTPVLYAHVTKKKIMLHCFYFLRFCGASPVLISIRTQERNSSVNRSSNR